MIQMKHNYARPEAPVARISLQASSPNLLAIVTRACETHGVAPSRFGRDAIGDPCLVRDLHEGRYPRPATRAAILAHADSLAGKAVAHA
ncbi:hypothetical protein [Sphingomonas sp. BE137]|uniref:hypothetical protein n=1 Tax=Sphingomonas sp. BE137 TaxID=2817844 RepID=UPI002865F795|nr:hypothetical protein [Sphingomonas sp. BE137]MDR6850369.1 hypothetical protein [Sphingomonas sp. BE137]